MYTSEEVRMHYLMNKKYEHIHSCLLFFLFKNHNLFCPGFRWLLLWDHHQYQWPLFLFMLDRLEDGVEREGCALDIFFSSPLARSSINLTLFFFFAPSDYLLPFPLLSFFFCHLPPPPVLFSDFLVPGHSSNSNRGVVIAAAAAQPSWSLVTVQLIFHCSLWIFLLLLLLWTAFLVYERW